MNEHILYDPQLQSLEARLAAAAPQASAGQQQHLLYQCALEAGKKRASRSLWRWQFATAVLVVLLLGMSAPFARDEWLLAVQRARPALPVEQPPRPVEMAPPVLLGQDLVPFPRPQTKVVELDAWQLPAREDDSITEEIAQLTRSDPQLHSLTMGTLSRELLNP